MKELDTRLDRNEGGQMSFLDHLDELRKRLVRSAIFIAIAFIFCFFASQRIYNFLAVPIVRALNEAAMRDVAAYGENAAETVQPLSSLKPGDRGRYVFDRTTRIGTALVQARAGLRTWLALLAAPWYLGWKAIIQLRALVSVLRRDDYFPPTARA